MQAGYSSCKKSLLGCHLSSHSSIVLAPGAPMPPAPRTLRISAPGGIPTLRSGTTTESYGPLDIESLTTTRQPGAMDSSVPSATAFPSAMKRGGEVSMWAAATVGSPLSARSRKQRVSGMHSASSFVLDAALKHALNSIPSCPGRGVHSASREAACSIPVYMLSPTDMPLGSPGSARMLITLSLLARIRPSLGSKTGTPPWPVKLSHLNDGSAAPTAVMLKRSDCPTAPWSSSLCPGVCPANTECPRRHPPCTSARTHAGGEHTPTPGHADSHSTKQAGKAPTVEQGGFHVSLQACAFDHVVCGYDHVPSLNATRTSGGVWTV
mmetsp:Transcript_4828/g.11419  ORF Transcript_4828/g.11419 Transcript_4828/m.11419 type:complete len:323 (-) Transcript_4828:1239-2207(-)